MDSAMLCALVPARLTKTKSAVSSLNMIDRSSSPILDFLQQALDGGAVSVPELEVKARTAGLLGERQQVRHAKAFKKAKKALGIRSLRDGFGRGGKWMWLMPPQVATESGSVANSDLASKIQRPVRDPELPDKSSAALESSSVVQQWQAGVQLLDYVRSPSAVPPIRWHLFLADCHKFLNSSENWAERAARLGWDAPALFGCHCTRPLEHLGSAGLLWAINGGKLVELHRDWAVIERAQDRSRRVHHRRSTYAANVKLPWGSLQRVQKDA
jgi:hypothetical protein